MTLTPDELGYLRAQLDEEVTPEEARAGEELLAEIEIEIADTQRPPPPPPRPFPEYEDGPCDG